MPKKISFDKYRDAKLKLLREDFKITLTKEEEARANALKTEIQVDQFFVGTINKRWN